MKYILLDEGDNWGRSNFYKIDNSKSSYIIEDRS